MYALHIRQTNLIRTLYIAVLHLEILMTARTMKSDNRADKMQPCDPRLLGKH